MYKYTYYQKVSLGIIHFSLQTAALLSYWSKKIDGKFQFWFVFFIYREEIELST